MLFTWLIIGVTCVVSYLAFNDPRLLDRLIFWPPAVRRGEYYRLLTHGFIHADGQHLLFNMLTLYFFGRPIERLYGMLLGPWGFIAFYLSAIVVAIVPTWLAQHNNPDYRSLGASGAVTAVLFAFILLSPWSTIIVLVVPMPAIVYAVGYLAYSFYMDRYGTNNVNHSAHLAGAIYGVLFTIIAEPRLLGRFLEQIGHPQFRF